jgi:hypothetical protein
MREDFIHYLWKHKKFETKDLSTTEGKPIVIVSTGLHNQDAGPDFFNSKIRINDQLWAGNIEIHLKSSDWFAHSHEKDKAYDNVILHVVWEHNMAIFRRDNSEIDTLELKQFVSKEALNNYHKLFSKGQKWINCENEFGDVDEFLLSNWLERLYFERLERKSDEINLMLEKSKNDWEAVLFKMLAKNFGLKVNGESFLSIANSIDFSLLRKEGTSILKMESLLFGQAGLLDGDKEDVYFRELKASYAYQRHKYRLKNQSVTSLQFFRLRPPNFPTIRLSQLANLYQSKSNLFAEILDANSVKKIYEILSISSSPYWETHYTFDKTSKKSKKKITNSFMDLMLINSIIPLKFSYSKYVGKSMDSEIIQWMTDLRSEKNSLVEKFHTVKPLPNNAMNSQALIQLKTNYCDKNNCLQCAIGNDLLSW